MARLLTWVCMVVLVATASLLGLKPTTSPFTATRAVGPNSITAAKVFTRANTVEFFAGQHTGSTGANQNRQINFPTQSFSLAENNVSITDAYVEISGQVGAPTATTYQRSFVYFDAASGVPSPSAYLTTASLGANTGTGQFVRLRAQVSGEADLAAYTGQSASKSFRVGYCFATGATCSGTASTNLFGMNAKLVITYTYAANSPTLTTTTRFPLKSGADAGTSISRTTPCLLGSCPTFTYQTVLPTGATQLSQWFHVTSFLVSWVHLSVGSLSGRIGSNPESPLTYWAYGGRDQMGQASVYLTSLTGYANNTTQTLEIRTQNNFTADAIGGENVVTFT